MRPEPGSVATAAGLLKLAAAPVPSAQAAAPLPARVLTRPEEVTALMRWLLWSATSTTEASPAATPAGPLKVAAVPWPSAKGVELELPARVVTLHTQAASTEGRRVRRSKAMELQQRRRARDMLLGVGRLFERSTRLLGVECLIEDTPVRRINPLISKHN